MQELVHFNRCLFSLKRICVIFLMGAVSIISFTGHFSSEGVQAFGRGDPYRNKRRGLLSRQLSLWRHHDHQRSYQLSWIRGAEPSERPQ